MKNLSFIYLIKQKMLPAKMRHHGSVQRCVNLCLLLIISYSCYVGAITGRIMEEETDNMQPCPFNLLCRCSRSGPEVGLIYCEDIPLADVPASMNNTKAFALYLRRNGLRRLEENSFHRTGTQHFFLEKLLCL